MEKFFNNIWYSRFSIFIVVLLPITFIYWLIISLRLFLYNIKFFKITKFNIPIIIIGNLTVGGSGKTPLCIWLANYLLSKKVRVGIVSSGYKSSSTEPQLIGNNSDPSIVGDEAILLYLQTKAIIVSGGDRVAATRYLLESSECDIIIHDDGLQHYALARSYEIGIIDADRFFGNGFLLPYGPLREPSNRINKCDMIAYSNASKHDIKKPSIFSKCNFVQNSITKEIKSLDEFSGKEIHLVIGIANISRILNNLKIKNIKTTLHHYNDHYAYTGNECEFHDEKSVFLTMKDYVKLKSSGNEKIWVMQHYVEPNEYFIEKLNKDLSNINYES